MHHFQSDPHRRRHSVITQICSALSCINKLHSNSAYFSFFLLPFNFLVTLSIMEFTAVVPLVFSFRSRRITMATSHMWTMPETTTHQRRRCSSMRAGTVACTGALHSRSMTWDRVLTPGSGRAMPTPTSGPPSPPSRPRKGCT